MDAAADQTIIRHQVMETGFEFYTSDEIRQLSVKQITSRLAFDTMGHTVIGGLYDPALGPIDFNMICPTCHLVQKECPGHMGHVELPVPVYNPVIFMTMLNILKRKCLLCHKFRMDTFKVRAYKVKLMLLNKGFIDEAVTLFDKLLERNGDFDETDAQTNRRKLSVLEDYERMLSSPAVLKRKVDKSRRMDVLKTQTINNFLASIKSARCENCRGFSPSLRQDAHAKIFLKPLGIRSAQKNADRGLSINSALDAINGIQSSKQTRLNVDVTEDDSDDDDDDENKTFSATSSHFLPPLEIRAQLQLLWKNEPIAEYMWGNLNKKMINKIEGWNKFFLHVIPVAPNRFRPPTMMEDTQFEHAQNIYLGKIIQFCEQLVQSDEMMQSNASENTKTDSNDVVLNLSRKLHLWMELQSNVNCLMDNSNAARPMDMPQGIRQVIEKKEGLFRKHMMGKRVNYSARSVISPDPYISTSEIGVPLRFAKKLTYPAPVTPWNVVEMRRLVINGPFIHPGANFVENEHGQLIDLSKRSLHQREAISKTLLTRSSSAQGNAQNKVKKVWRHLRTGDVVLMNRQPTLHKPSMMAHVTRVLTNPAMQTIRMHYANCNTFNADFDGDEMNMHFPQNELARAEAYQIASNDNQYIVPTDGSPLRGLIQDHVDSGVKLTKRDTFITKDMYVQLIFNAWSCLEHLGAERAHIELIPPAILKPKRLWSGKQVITTLLNLLTKDLPPLNLNSKTKVKAESFGPTNAEHIVVFRDGELLQGVLDKSQFGASEYGFVHAVYELYGSRIAADLLTALGRLFTTYLQFAGHTCALEDLTLNNKAEEHRRQLVQESIVKGQQAYASFAGIEKEIEMAIKESRPLNEKEREIVRQKMQLQLSGEQKEDMTKALDAHMMGCVHGSNSEIIKACLPGGQSKPFPWNCFSLMVLTGAKGSMVNHSQISCGLGQQALEGRRVPILVSGRSLPSFEPYDPSPRAGGYITDRFLTGLRPQEYYHHCMAGREGLVDTAVKTSRSGYLQRCLVKHLEDLTVGYDHTVRDSDGHVIQFLYGEDGIDPVESAFLSGKDDQMTFLAMNHNALSHKFSIHGQFFENTGLDMMKPIEMNRILRTCKDNPFSIGMKVLTFRRIDSKKKWKRGNIEKGYIEAFITNIHQNDTDEFLYDVLYQDTQLPGFKLPQRIWIKQKEKDSLTTPMSGYIDVVKPYIYEPIMHSLPLNNHIGTVSERIQHQIDSYNTRNPTHVLTLSKKQQKKLQKRIKKQQEQKNIKEKEMNELVKLLTEQENSRGISSAAFELLVWVKYMRSLCQPGENVGTIAAQGIGEPSTQMTLNTFHLAGHGAANVTLGIPRLREIIMTASQHMKTPSMTIPLRSNITREKAKLVEQNLNQISLYSLIRHENGILVEESLKQGEDQVLWVREYRIRIHYHVMKEIKRTFGLRSKHIYSTFGKKFVPELLRTIRHELRKSGIVIGSSSTSKNEKDDEDVEEMEAQMLKELNNQSKKDDEEEEDEDEQGTLTFGQKKEIRGYGEMDEDELHLQKEQQNEFNSMNQMKSKNKKDTLSESDEENEMTNSMNLKKKTNLPVYEKKHVQILETSNVARKNTNFLGCFVNKEEHYTELRLCFPANAKKLLLIPLVERVSQKILVRHCPGISRCYFIKQRLNGETEERDCIQTEGLNFQRIWEFEDLLDMNLLQTNDIYQVLVTYGVEAARASISKQINDVFGVYGINVDPRHLNLLADYMTFSGGYMPLNRAGMANKGSPFQQITFETSMTFLANAATFGQSDEMNSSSSRLILGQPAKVGTGSFELMQPIQL